MPRVKAGAAKGKALNTKLSANAATPQLLPTPQIIDAKPAKKKNGGGDLGF